MADELEEKLRLKLAEKYEEKVNGKISEFGHLLTRRAAVRLLCKENGIDTERRISLSQAASETLPFSFSASVDRIFPVQTFASGEKCVRLHLSDKGGSGTLVLWNAQASLVEGTVSTGDELMCRGAYFRGGEMHLGREGAITVVKKNPATPVGKLTAGVCSTEGTVEEVEPDYHYLDKKTGGKKKMSSFQLCEIAAGEAHGKDARAGAGKICRRVILWSTPEGTPSVEEGDSLLLENVTFKNGELHFNSFSRMVRKISARERSGKVESAEIVGGEAVLRIGKGAFRFSVNDALALLGITKVPDGVLPSTVLSIRLQTVVGKRAHYKEENGKLSWLQLGE